MFYLLSYNLATILRSKWKPSNKKSCKKGFLLKGLRDISGSALFSNQPKARICMTGCREVNNMREERKKQMFWKDVYVGKIDMLKPIYYEGWSRIT